MGQDSNPAACQRPTGINIKGKLKKKKINLKEKHGSKSSCSKSPLLPRTDLHCAFPKYPWCDTGIPAPSPAGTCREQGCSVICPACSHTLINCSLRAGRCLPASQHPREAGRSPFIHLNEFLLYQEKYFPLQLLKYDIKRKTFHCLEVNSWKSQGKPLLPHQVWACLFLLIWNPG